MFIANYKDIFNAVKDNFPGSSELHTEYPLPDYKGSSTKITARGQGQYFLVDVDSGINYCLNEEGQPKPSGVMDKANAELKPFMDWIAEVVGADKPVWEKTWREKTFDEVSAMSEEALHAEMQVHLKGKPKQGWSRLTGIFGCHVSYYANGKIELEKAFYVRDWERPSNHEVLVALVCANRQQKHDRSEAAKKAAITRKNRKDKKIHKLAMGFVISNIKPEPSHECHCCGKALKDKESRARGIGPECWTNWLNVVEVIVDKQAKE